MLNFEMNYALYAKLNVCNSPGYSCRLNLEAYAFKQNAACPNSNFYAVSLVCVVLKVMVFNASSGQSIVRLLQ